MGRMKRVLSASAVVALATAASSSSALAQAHAADEWVALEQLDQAAAHYRRILGGAP